MTPVALTIAGSDPSGGAGIQADLKTFHRFGVYGEAAITLLTVQNTQRVSQVEIMDPDLVTAQIAAVLEDIPPNAAKLGRAWQSRSRGGRRGYGAIVVPLPFSRRSGDDQQTRDPANDCRRQGSDSSRDRPCCVPCLPRTCTRQLL